MKSSRLASPPIISAHKSQLSKEPQTILLAVTGMSPAILTETAWALAHENPPIIPARVIPVTTLSGARAIQHELLEPPSAARQSIWQQMRRAVLGPKPIPEPLLILDGCRIITKPNARTGSTDGLEDIRTPAQNEAAANFILEEVRRIVENPDTTLIASLAGGRKTMGALLYACLSLLGRPQDRLTHVLVNEPFDNPALNPRFYFPQPAPITHQFHDPRTGNLETVKSSAASLVLADVPFVRLRQLFPRQIGKFPGSFSALVHAYSDQIETLGSPPAVQFDPDRPRITVNGTPIDISRREFALFNFLAERCHAKAPPFQQQKDALDPFKNFLDVWRQTYPPENFRRTVADEWKNPTEDDLRKQISSLKAKLTTAGLTTALRQLLPQRGCFGIRVQLSPAKPSA